MASEPILVSGWQQQVLSFWYGEIGPGHWFKRSDAVDKQIAERFGALHARLEAAIPEGAADSAKGALATLIVLDQFSRNLYRGSARAFACDAAALALAERTVRLGLDRLLRKDERLFVYLPFEHAEDRGAQERSVTLFRALGQPEWLRYADAHKAIIDRFGRYPHRNAALGRTSTPEEIEFLKMPGSSF